MCIYVNDSFSPYKQHYCCRNGHTDICHLLLQRSANPNIQTKSGRVTPLHRAAYSGHVEIVKLLLAAGASTLIQDSDGKIPLHKVLCQFNSGQLAKDNSVIFFARFWHFMLIVILSNCFALKFSFLSKVRKLFQHFNSMQDKISTDGSLYIFLRK